MNTLWPWCFSHILLWGWQALEAQELAEARAEDSAKKLEVERVAVARLGSKLGQTVAVIDEKDQTILALERQVSDLSVAGSSSAAAAQAFKAQLSAEGRAQSEGLGLG